MTDNSDGERGRPRGAVAAEGGRRRRGFPWWLLGLLALALIALAVWALTRDDDDDRTAAGGTAATAPTDTGTGAPEATGTGADAGAGEGATGTGADGGTGTGADGGAGGAAGAAAGTLTSGGANLLGAEGAANLAAQSGQAAQGRGVNVQSVVSDEGFWVGSSEQDRVFVALDIQGESPFQVTAGEKVDLQGTVTALETPEAFGVTAAEGLDQLRQQGQYIRATSLERAS